MPEYEVTIPGRGTFTVNSDKELTDDLVHQYALQQANMVESHPLIKRAAGLLARSAIEGSLAAPVVASSGLGGAYNVAANALPGENKGFRFPDTGVMLSNKLTELGLPKPESLSEKVADFGWQGLFGSIATPGANAAKPLYNAPYSGNLSNPQAFSTATSRAAGYTLPPSATGEGNIGTNIVESLGGKAAIKQEATLRNQNVTTELARGQAGLRAGTPVTEDTLAAARDVAASPYDEVAGLSRKAALALSRLKQARFDMNQQYKFYNRSANPQALADAQALEARVGNLENIISNEAIKSGRPDLPGRLEEARRAIAKNFDVRTALNPDTGDVVAKDIAKIPGAEQKFTGDMATIRRFANAFPQYAGEGAKTPAPDVNHLKSYAAMLTGIGGAALGYPYHGAGLAAGELFGPALARQWILSQGVSPWLASKVGLDAADTLLPASVFGAQGLLSNRGP